MDQTFLELLNSQYQWPSDYLFKFVVPKESLAAFVDKVEIGDYQEKQSSNGNYISLTFTWNMKCAEDVIKVYQKANEVKGVFAL